MKAIREQFEEIWPVPDGIEWSMNIGLYVCNDDVRITQEHVNTCVEWDARLETFTRCQESQAIVTSLNDDLLKAMDALINASAELWEFCVNERLDPNDPKESAEPDELKSARAIMVKARGES